MNDTLSYVEHEPVHRRFHHDELTFSLVYAWDENFVLPLSHDEVVHGKRSLLSKLPGRPLAAARDAAGAVRADVGPPGQAAALHGRRARRVGRVVGGPLARLAAARRSRPRGRAGRRARPQRRLPGAAGALGGRLPARGVRLARRRRARRERDRVRPLRGRRARRSSASSTSPRSCGRAGACRCPAAAAGSRCSTPTRASTRAPTSATGSASQAEASPLHGQPFSALVTLPPLATIWLVPGMAAVEERAAAFPG